MNFVFHPDTRPNWDRWCFYEGAFSDEECDKLLQLFKENELQAAQVASEVVIDLKVRDSRVQFLTWSQEHDWIFQKIYAFVKNSNDHRWQFDVTGMLEGLQLTKYGTRGHYDWHQDNGVGAFSKRKISFVVQLTREEEYEGGTLEFFKGGEAKKSRGTIVLFPSFEMHKVNPVTKGERYSLVGWISGPPFR